MTSQPSAFFVLVRRRARKRSSDLGDVKKRLAWKVHICSENNFPTAAGLASSAAGLACLGLSCCCCISVVNLITHISQVTVCFSPRVICKQPRATC